MPEYNINITHSVLHNYTIIHRIVALSTEIDPYQIFCIPLRRCCRNFSQIGAAPDR